LYGDINIFTFITLNQEHGGRQWGGREIGFQLTILTDYRPHHPRHCKVGAHLWRQVESLSGWQPVAAASLENHAVHAPADRLHATEQQN